MFDDAVPDQPSAVGSVLYRHHFPVVVELTTVYRQLDRGFRELLNNVRDGSTTAENVALLRMRVFDRLPPGGDLDARGTFPRLYTMKHLVDRFNNQKLAEDDGFAVARIRADHFGRGASVAPPDFASGLRSELLLKKGCRVMLRMNICVSRGLVNGAVGVVHNIVYDEGTKPPNDLPFCILVQFDSYSGPSCVIGIARVVQICRQKASFQFGRASCRERW